MIYLHHACRGASHEQYQVIAIKYDHDEAVKVLENLKHSVKNDKNSKVGFVEVWLVTPHGSESIDRIFIWDHRN